MAIRVEEIDLVRDRGLVEAWQAGDESAFDELYRRYFDRLRAFCQRRVGDRSTAEEIAQEAFVRALQALPRFEGERRFYPWMTVIAGRLCIDHHRRNSRVQPSDEVDPGSVEDGVDELLSLQVDLDHLDRAFKRLGPRHAEVLNLRERRGLSYHDIAAELDVPHSTVEALLFRARKALRREFQFVSAERLVAIPGIGWAISRAVRLRDRIAATGADLGNVMAPLAAGAMTAVIVALPSPAPVPAVMTTGSQHSRPAAVAPPADVPVMPAVPAPELPRSSGAGTDTEPPAGLSVVDDDDAQRRAEAMPVHVDDVPETGIGVNPDPVLANVPVATRSLP